jgi:hypothetical protein
MAWMTIVRWSRPYECFIGALISALEQQVDDGAHSYMFGLIKPARRPGRFE